MRALLAVLLLRANEVVSSDRLVEELWPTDPPQTSENTVQVYVSRLRRLLGPGLLETRPPGYVLKLDPAQLDLHRFSALLRESEAAPADIAADRLRSALALWRGDPLADLSDQEF